MSKKRFVGLMGAVVFVGLVSFCIGILYQQSGLVTTTSISVSEQMVKLPPSEHATEASADESISLVFVGDMMFDRHIRLHAQKNGYDALLSAQLKQLLASADLVIGNLEGPITDEPSNSLGSKVGSPANYSFTFDPAVVSFLQNQNIRLVNLGNNHILNFGQDGLEQTYAYLQKGAISSFGATGSGVQAQRWHTVTIHNTRFAFVNYNQFIQNGYEQALADLETVRPLHDVVIVYAHWGNEYVPENAVLKEQARNFQTLGADLIIGSHPHVVTGIAEIESTKVYYSLGNFIFDQYFEPAVQAGLVVEAHYDPAQKMFSFTDHAVKLEPSGVTALADEQL